MSGQTLLDAQSTAALDFEALPADYFTNPHPYLRSLRAHDPLHRNGDGSILVTRHEDVRRIWRDLSAVVDKRELFMRRFGSGPLLEHHTSTMLFRDPPDHDRLRAIVNPLFMPAAMLRFKAAADDLVAELVAQARDKGEIDFLTEFAYPLTTQLICQLLGLPVEDGQLIGELARQMAIPLNPDASAHAIAAGHAAAGELKTYLAERVAAARRAPAPDAAATVLGAMIAAGQGPGGPSEIELQHMLILMFNGGYESTANFLTVALMGLVDDPARLDEFRGGTLQINAAIEELARFVTPLQLQGRRLTREVELSAGTLSAGTEVVISVASANWDETAFTHPEQIDFGRRPNRHLGFGAGVHICIGKPLAKIEAIAALPAFTRAFAKIERTGASQFRPTPRFRGVNTLPLRLGPA